MNYTQGEWLVIGHNNLVAVLRKSRYVHIADCEPGNFLKSDIPQNEVAVNSQLIASAPDMYEALKAILNKRVECHETESSYISPEIELAYRAIAKAEGKDEG